MEKEKAGAHEPLLNSVAEKIGSTLGTVAAKAESVRKAILPAGKRSSRPTARRARPVASRAKRRSPVSKRRKSARAKRRGSRT